MKVAVVGASGNAGTALLHALHEDETVTEVVAVARRLPDTGRWPYEGASWARVDIGAPHLKGDDDVVTELERVFAGADAVVHLAWITQPNHERDLLRRVNVEGTRRVALAARRAGVRHLVVASSVGAYSAVDDDERRGESWSRHGIPTSHYAVDKAAQERVLDEAEAAGLTVTRVRPALVFDAEAGAEIVRLFIGPFVPPKALRPDVMPVVPLPAGLRLQVVHAADLADAYRRIVVQRAGGAFNIATEPVLDADAIADVLGGRRVDVPPAVLRRALALAWRSRLVAADPGWLDLALSVPVMETSRARTELGWEPRHDAHETLHELLEGIASGHGAPSAPLRARRRWPQDSAPPGQVGPGTLAPSDQDSPDHRVPPEIDRRALARYLNNHATGAFAGLARFESLTRTWEHTEHGAELADLTEEIRAERDFLTDLLVSLEIPVMPPRRAAMRAGAMFGGLLTSGRPGAQRMHLTLELEILRGAVMVKLGSWQTLARIAPTLGLPAATFESLAAQAREQAARLEALHERARDAIVSGETAG